MPEEVKSKCEEIELDIWQTHIIIAGSVTQAHDQNMALREIPTTREEWCNMVSGTESYL